MAVAGLQQPVLQRVYASNQRLERAGGDEERACLQKQSPAAQPSSLYTSERQETRANGVGQ